MANAFRNHKKALLEAGELSPRTLENYTLAADTLVAYLGKALLVADLNPQDFADLRASMAKRWGPHRLGVTLQHIRSMGLSEILCRGAGRAITPDLYP